jgi:hypothetical protein
MDYLSAANLMQHVQALADAIGPRPAGSRAELQARQYVRHALRDGGVEAPVEEQTFSAPDTWGYVAIWHAATGVFSNFLRGRWRKTGALLTAFSAYSAFQYITNRRDSYTPLVPSNESANLIVRIPAKTRPRHKVVLIGHLDTNKHRLTFTPLFRSGFRVFSTAGIILGFVNAVAQWFGWNWLRKPTALALTSALPLLALDEIGPFVAGANDNASAAACLLGLGAQFNTEPLENTEVWLVFTGAEESGCLGLHQLLDTYRVELANAYFIDFEMVGAGDISFVTHHSSFSYFGAYRPDEESLELAISAAKRHPELDVRGKSLTISEEVGALRSRGFRGICLAGVGSDGWLVNWHRITDTSQNIEPAKLQTAARFALAMIQTLDERP